MFGSAAASAIEAGQTISGLTFTVSGLLDGANEVIVVDGSTVALGANSSGTTSGNGLTYNVTVGGGTATIVLSGGSLSAAATQTLVDGIAYQNTDTDNPTAGSRVVTLTQIVDSGGGTDATALSIASTVTVAAINDAPTLTASTLDPTFSEAAGLGAQAAAVAVFGSAAASAIEAGQTISGLTFTVSGLLDGANEVIVVDGSTVALGANSSGTTSGNGLTYNVTVGGGTATIVLSGGSLSAAATQTLVDGIAYQNTDTDNPTAGSRVVTLTQIVDSGGGTDTRALSIASTVSVAVVNDAPVITGGPGTAGLTETNAGLTTAGTLTVSDPERTDTVTATVDSLAVSGTSNLSDPAKPSGAALLTMLGLSPTTILNNTQTSNTLNWTFDSGSEAFDYLAAGETLVLTYTVKATDDAGAPLSGTETVTITITGSNDGPTVDASTATAFTEAADASAQNLVQAGTVTFDDIDSSDLVDISAALSTPAAWSGGVIAPGLAAALESGFSASISNAAAPGSVAWNYNVSALDLDFLDDGETITLTYTVTATDSQAATATDTVTITINGSNDAPLITVGGGDAASAAIAETDTTLTSAGTLTVTDADLTDSRHAHGDRRRARRHHRRPGQRRRAGHAQRRPRLDRCQRRRRQQPGLELQLRCPGLRLPRRRREPDADLHGARHRRQRRRRRPDRGHHDQRHERRAADHGGRRRQRGRHPGRDQRRPDHQRHADRQRRRPERQRHAERDRGRARRHHRRPGQRRRAGACSASARLDRRRTPAMPTT